MNGYRSGLYNLLMYTGERLWQGYNCKQLTFFMFHIITTDMKIMTDSLLELDSCWTLWYLASVLCVTRRFCGIIRSSLQRRTK